MAATSHDFWLGKLGPRASKRLHMIVYVTWGLLVMHVALGALQAERSTAYVVALVAVVLSVGALHVVAGRKETLRPQSQISEAGWVNVCAVNELVEGRGRVVVMPGKRERVALFRYDGRVSAMSNACAHQGGPLGDPKCFARAMKPGDGKTHKGCAVLCLRGGIPAVFVAADRVYLLVDEAGIRCAGRRWKRRCRGLGRRWR
jgi:nitrite reductase/ring-hydroxylating ferredoxin subunit